MNGESLMPLMKRIPRRGVEGKRQFCFRLVCSIEKQEQDEGNASDEAAEKYVKRGTG